MYILNGIFLILAGLGAMGFGLMIFYTLLPLFYAMFGYGVGYWLGSLLTSAPPGEMSFIKFMFAFGGAILFAFAAYFLEAYRRIADPAFLVQLEIGILADAVFQKIVGYKKASIGVLVIAFA